MNSQKRRWSGLIGAFGFVVFVAALFAPGAAQAVDYSSLKLPAGTLLDTTGKVIQPSDLSGAKETYIDPRFPLLVPLAGLTPGCYRVGVLMETGMDTSDPYMKADWYSVAVQHGDGAAQSVSAVAPPSDRSIQPVVIPATPNSRSSVRGLLVSSKALWLTPDMKVGLVQTGGANSVVTAILLMPVVKPADAISISLAIDAPDNAFTPDDPPLVHIALSNGLNAPWTGLVRLSMYDLLTRQTTPSFLPVTVPSQADATVDYKPALLAGVFRLDATPSDGKGDADAGVSTARTFMAYSPAKIARDLPDDWPLATHYPSSILHAPMPGFKWYRVFDPWSSLNPSRGVYNWKELDGIMADIQKVGGKVLLNLEGPPAWAETKATGDPQKDGRAFDPAYLPDYRLFVRALVDRYDSKSPLGALEVDNEYNANHRWNWRADSNEEDMLVTLHKITYEETRRTQGRIKVVGITLSPGHHVGYIDDITERGVLNYLDIIGGHFYEEVGSYNRLDLRNNFPLHVDLLRLPMLRAKIYRPIWDTESGMGWEDSNGRPRPGGVMLTQDEWVAQLKARPDYNPNDPWRMWASPSEPRMAEEVVTAAVEDLANDIEMHYTFSPNWYSLDKTLNMPWVANGCLGEVLSQVDYHYVVPLGINAVGGPDDIGAVAYRIGKPGEKQVVVMWAERVAIKHPFPASYTNFIEPVPVQLGCVPGTEVTVQDMYLRTQTKVKSAKYPGGDAVTINVGEEPVYIWNWQWSDL